MVGVVRLVSGTDRGGEGGTGPRGRFVEGGRRVGGRLSGGVGRAGSDSGRGGGAERWGGAAGPRVARNK